MLVGHGLVPRQVRGPVTPESRPEQLLVLLRRYRCRACRAVLLVGPRGLTPRRWYSASAIALAFAAIARGQTSAAARSQTSPTHRIGPSAADRWLTLDRWLAAARRGELFAVAGLVEMPRRRVAEQVVLALAARAGYVPGADLAHSAFLGAALAA